MTRRAPLQYPAPGARDPAVISVIALCTAIELAIQIAELGLLDMPGLRNYALAYGAFWPGLLDGWQPYYPAQPWAMFLTYGFLHGGALHLVLNMVTLFSLSAPIVFRIGTARFFWVYFGSMIGGGAVYAFLSTSGQPMVGASGALFGLAGALLAWQWDDQPTLRAAMQATWRALVLLVAINIVLYFALQGSLAWQTHLGGFLAGWIIALALDRQPGSRGRSR